MTASRVQFPRLAVLASALLLAPDAHAHTFWLQPDTFTPSVNAPVPLRILVGDGLPGERKTRNNAKVERFDVVGPTAEAKPTPIEAADGADPVGAFTPSQPGVHAVLFRGKETLITLEADKFEEYLKEEGLTTISAKRAELAETAKPGREAYSRAAKSLVRVGSATDGAWNLRAGLKLELVPVSNPYAAKAAEPIRFLLLRDGKPVLGAKVGALGSDASGTVRLKATTNDEGIVSLTLPTPGLWVIHSVSMTRAEARTDVDWISVWTSLSFDLAPASKP